MMAPHYERARMLHAAIDLATLELREPIERLEVSAGRVFAWAGRRRVAMRYCHEDRSDPDGHVMPGSGEWVVEKTALADTPRNFVARVLGWLRRR
jgi:hypothetical protein